VTFASYVRRARAARGLSLRKCAADTGVHVSHLSHVEHGLLPSLKLVGRLAAALDLPPDDLAARAIREYQSHDIVREER
jgi:transcriptional regulator with XRE-family HTH domain